MMHENAEVRVEIDSQDWITVTNKRSGLKVRLTIAGMDIVFGAPTITVQADRKNGDVAVATL